LLLYSDVDLHVLVQATLKGALIPLVKHNLLHCFVTGNAWQFEDGTALLPDDAVFQLNVDYERFAIWCDK